MQQFATTMEPLLNRIAENERESHTLVTLRDTLLPRLLSGEVMVAATPYSSSL
jgi:type I restriction enzyme S subunit